ASGASAATEVVAGAERGTGARQRDGMDPAVEIRFPQGVVQLVQETGRQGVALVGTVEEDAGPSPLDLVDDLGELRHPRRSLGTGNAPPRIPRRLNHL